MQPLRVLDRKGLPDCSLCNGTANIGMKKHSDIHIIHIWTSAIEDLLNLPTSPTILKTFLFDEDEKDAKPESPTRIGIAAYRNPGKKLKQISVLLLVEDTFRLIALEKLFAAVKFKVEAASTIEDAQNLIKTAKVHIAFGDFDFCEKVGLAKIAETGQEVVLIINKPDVIKVITTIGAGACEFLFNPVTVEEFNYMLLHVVKYLQPIEDGETTGADNKPHETSQVQSS